ncbi:MAG TPA: DUF5666 domain-containing protein [Ktedonobacteraceae bacterium]
MRDFEDAASTCLSQSPASRSHRRRRLLIGGLVFVLAFMLAIGVALSTGATRAEALASISHSGPIHGLQETATPGEHHGDCHTFTVSSVTGSTIVARSPCGKTITVHTTGSTHYVEAGKNVSMSAIRVGTRVYVTGSRNSDGSITASRIVIH